MDWTEAYQAFVNQQVNAAKKRVPFAITFKDWCDLWGDQIEQRGTLQLQRIDRQAGYVPGNLRISRRPCKGVK